MLRTTFPLAMSALLIAASAHGENANDFSSTASAANLRQAISRCLAAPPGSANVRVAFVLKPDGMVDGMPRILDGDNDPNARTFALAAVRAILQCSPYQGGLSGKIIVNFSQAAD